MSQPTTAPPAVTTRIPGRWLLPLRIGWVVLSVYAVAVFIASLRPYLGNYEATYSAGYSAFLLALEIVVGLVWFVVAGVIAWRKSDDWLALLVAFMLVNQGASSAIYPLAGSPGFWGVSATGVSLLAYCLLLLVFSLFPTGRFVPRWLPLALVAAVAWQLLPYLGIFHGAPLWVGFVGFYLFIAIVVGAQVYRYRTVSSRTERQQTKWVVYGIMITLLCAMGFSLLALLFPSLVPIGSLADLVLSPLANAVPVLVPISFGFAILRSRLWEIDHLINRTIVYGALTATLALVYFGLVVVLQSLFRTVTGQSNGVGIVISTLVVAALFQPLRQRIQGTIDSRFYRRKYNAARTLESFGATLRTEVELNQLSARLLAIVHETMQPDQVSLWLAPLRRTDGPAAKEGLRAASDAAAGVPSAPTD